MKVRITRRVIIDFKPRHLEGGYAAFQVVGTYTSIIYCDGYIVLSLPGVK